MVKNIQGGNKSKGFARKNLIKKDTLLRVAQEDGEIYAQAIKIMGGKIVSVIDINGNQLTGHIRKKFSGRGKRDNLISPGTWLLVGLHTWETTKTDKPPNCDILEVYSDSDKSRLKNTINSVNWSLFINNDNKILLGDNNNNNEDDCGIVFVDELTQEYEDIINKHKNTKQAKIIDYNTDNSLLEAKEQKHTSTMKGLSNVGKITYNNCDINIDDI